MIDTVFFDLDGTLADTAPDLASALNKVLTEEGLPTITVAEIKPTVSLGGNMLIKQAFGISEDADNFSSIRKRFLEHYASGLHVDSQLFPGISEVLQRLESDNIKWGIVTNKLTWLTEPLVKRLELQDRAACIVCGDSTNFQKPHPGPMLEACRLTDSHPAHSLYIGDARRDIDAGRAAGMYTMIAKYGYINTNENINDWHADAIIELPIEIIEWIANKQQVK